MLPSPPSGTYFQVSVPGAELVSYFIGLPFSPALGVAGRCEAGIVTHKDVAYWPFDVSIHSRDVIDDNPCTADSCDSCIGMVHAPQNGKCRVGDACGQCVAGGCDAAPSAVIYDLGLPGVALAHPRGLPDGGVLAEVEGAKYGLARWTATGEVAAQIWSDLPMRQADSSLDSGNVLANVELQGFGPEYVAFAFDATTLKPGSLPLASSIATASGGPPLASISSESTVSPLSLPGGGVAATSHGAGIDWGLLAGNGVWSVGAATHSARQGAHGIVVFSTLVPVLGSWMIPIPFNLPVNTVDYEGSWVTPLTGNVSGKPSVLGNVAYQYSLAASKLPGVAEGATTLDGLAYTPDGRIAAWGRVRQTAWAYPVAAAIWLAGDVTSVLQTVIFDELPSVEGVVGWQNPGVGGVILPDGGVAAQVGRAVAWTDGSGKKIGYALLPKDMAGMRLFATWNDGTIGLFDPGGHRLAKIPWSWAGSLCP